MSFWRKLFGLGKQPTEASANSTSPTTSNSTPTAPVTPAAAPVTSSVASSAGNVPQPATSSPVSSSNGQSDLRQIAELFLRSYLILTGQAQGSFQQAKDFDDWLESYRCEGPQVLAMAAMNPGAAEATVEIPGGAVLLWEISDPQNRFLCCFCGDPGYIIPRDAAPMPQISDFTPPSTPLARIKSVTAAAESRAPRAPRKMELLRQKLADDNIMIRLDAVTELEQDGTPEALPGLRVAMRNDSIAVRIQSGYALGKVTEAIVPGWAKPFQGSPKPAQFKAVRKLDSLAAMQAAAIPELVHTVLTDNHMAAVAIAVTGLCMIGQKGAMIAVLTTDLLRGASDEEFNENYAAIDRLNAAGIAAIQGLEHASLCRSDNARQDVQNTLRTISRFRDQIMRLGWLFHPKRSGEGQDPPETNLQEVADAVTRLSTAEGDLRSNYALWLALRDPVIVGPYVPGIAQALRDPEASVRVSVALALGALGRYASLAVLPLREACEDSVARVRVEAARALGRIGIAAGLSVEKLNQMAKQDPDSDVREAARDAVERIGPAFL